MTANGTMSDKKRQQMVLVELNPEVHVPKKLKINYVTFTSYTKIKKKICKCKIQQDAIDDVSNVNDEANTGDESRPFKYTSYFAENILTHHGLNQNLRRCLRKTREAFVISSQLDGARPRPTKNSVFRDNDVFI